MLFVGHKIPFVSMGSFYYANVIHNEGKPKSKGDQKNPHEKLKPKIAKVRATF